MFIDKEKTVEGLKVWDMPASNVREISPVCRAVAADGAVLLRNEGNVLPFVSGEKLAVFGRIQNSYYKSGTGSGGMVNVDPVPSLIDAMRAESSLCVDEELAKIYADWEKDNPFDYGEGWGLEPWSQVEMPLESTVADAAAKRCDAAVVFIGRSAGEDHDSSETPGSYQLSETEEDMIKKVCAAFSKVAVVLNVGNIIDLSFIEKYNVPAVMYVWQGGMEGSRAVADLLCAKSTPNGRLADTQAKSIEDYPAHGNFGGDNQVFYVEDIYVGYRYFETLAPEKVVYPFGLGLSYTTFDTKYSAEICGDEIVVKARVANVGKFKGREVLQVYFKAPCGALGTPARQLVAYAKTKELLPGEDQTISTRFNISKMASYDDSGVTGNKSCYVLQSGVYEVFAGENVRSAAKVIEYCLEETVVTQQLEEAMAPVVNFDRLVVREDNSGGRYAEKEAAPTRQIDLEKRISERRMPDIAYTGDNGIKLVDVASGKNTMEEFVAQLSVDELCCIVCGEGMSSPKVTAGTGGAIGGVTDSLLEKGVPVACVTDGPSGIRMDSGAKAASIPNGMALACSFDDELVEKLHAYIGVEMFAYTIDSLLGPGMNLHRHPLNGRNFEYFSEDPLLTGKIAAAICRGIAQSGCSATIKHFCCNSQEHRRRWTDSIVSERALREIYLKGFEIAVKEGGAIALMTSYNGTNGFWCASNYDLTTTILRREWGYDGFVMTDWGAGCNCEGEGPDTFNLKAMVRAQNDIFMVCPNAEEREHNIREGLAEGYITLGDLQRNAINLLKYIMSTPTFMKYVDGGCRKPVFSTGQDGKFTQVFQVEDIQPGDVLVANFGGKKDCRYDFEMVVNADELSQHNVIVEVEGGSAVAFAVMGTQGNRTTVNRFADALEGKHTMTFKFDECVKIIKFTIWNQE